MPDPGRGGGTGLRIVASFSDINSNSDMKRQGLGLQAKSGADALGSGD